MWMPRSMLARCVALSRQLRAKYCRVALSIRLAVAAFEPVLPATHTSMPLSALRASLLFSRGHAPLTKRGSFKQRDQGVLFGSLSTSHRGICGIESERLSTRIGSVPSGWQSCWAARRSRPLRSGGLGRAWRRTGASNAGSPRARVVAATPLSMQITRQSESLGGLRARAWRLLRTFDQQHDAESDLEDMLPVLEEQYIPHAKHDLDREAIDE